MVVEAASIFRALAGNFADLRRRDTSLLVTFVLTRMASSARWKTKFASCDSAAGVADKSNAGAFRQPSTAHCFQAGRVQDAVMQLAVTIPPGKILVKLH
jgi:hypothetical protein